ncbi:hypothetical protein [Noviherbaspirillum denitrificans]|nr:hypothetical protein [Noviherbaspirillum denitrificans]
MKPRKQFDVPEAEREFFVSEMGAATNHVMAGDALAEARDRFDFSPWYGKRIDAITDLLAQSLQQLYVASTYQKTSVTSLFNGGVRKFLSYCVEQAQAQGRELQVEEINRPFIDHYLAWIRRQLKDDGEVLGYVAQRSIYTKTKSILVQACRQGRLPDRRQLFPSNPFPQVSRHYQGEQPLSLEARRRFAEALRIELAAIARDEFDGTDGQALALVCLLIALRTGLNTTPLLELSRDALLPHPLKPNWRMLVSHKRRGNATHVQSMRWSDQLVETASAQTDVVWWYDWVKDRTAPLVAEAPVEWQQRLWLYRREQVGRPRSVLALTVDQLILTAQRLVRRHALVGDDGEPLRVNVATLRKTFVNRLYELSGRDMLVTARLAGHSVQVSQSHYLKISPEAKRAFHFAGTTLLSTLQTASPGPEAAAPAAATPIGHCADPVHGERAPQQPGRLCTDFLSCFQCKSMVVTTEDLWRLFSFYYLIDSERNILNARDWEQWYGHVRDIIDTEIAPDFPAAAVKAARERARREPHPYWKTRDRLGLPHGARA